MANHLALRVMMIGGRRAGKTSALAAMQDCFDRMFQDTALSISPADSTTLDVIEAKRQELENYLAKASRNENFTPDNTPTQGDDTYSFYVKLRGKPDTVRLDFYDFNGEWLLPGSSHYEDVREQVHQSDVLMIIIDTPYLMEDDGTYNDVRNRCFRITQTIKNDLDVAAEVLPKMVLFVPLKCEKYYDDGKMGEVYKRIVSQHCYGTLIDHLKGYCEMAIVPIQTIGTAAFFGFDWDPDTGDVMMAKEKDGKEFPSMPLYAFTAKAVAAAERMGLGRKYAADPQYCEQPAVYTLYYALTYAARVAEGKEKESKRGFLGLVNPKLGENVLKFVRDIIPSEKLDQAIQNLRDRYDFTSAADFLAQREAVYTRMKRGGDGYDILLPDVLGFSKGEKR